MALARLQPTPLSPTGLTAPLSARELERKPIEFGSFWTCCSSRPSEASWAAMLETDFPPSRIVWKLLSTPATDVRLIRSIAPVAVAPGTWLHERVLPVKIDTSCADVRFESGLAWFVTAQIAYLAI